MIKSFIRLNIEPIGKPRMTQRDKWKKRPVVLKYHAFKDFIRLNKGSFELADKYSMVVFIPFPKSYSKKKCKALFLKAHQEKPDKDNIEKAIMDSPLRTRDDKEIYDSRVRKVWSYKPAIVIINHERD